MFIITRNARGIWRRKYFIDNYTFPCTNKHLREENYTVHTNVMLSNVVDKIK